VAPKTSHALFNKGIKMEIFTNREIASVIWIVVFSIFFITKKNCRSAFYKVLKTMFSIKILIYIFSSIAFFTALMFSINKFFAIDLSLLKDSLVWFITSGLIITGNSFTCSDTKSILSKHILENLKVTVLIEFILATYVFSLFMELLIIPIILFFSLLNVVSENDENYKPIYKATSALQNIIGLGIIIFSIYSAMLDYNNFIGIASIKSFILPFVLMIFYFPFSYCWILYAKYEVLFLVIKKMYSNMKNPELGKQIKKRILIFCGLNYNRVSAIRDNKYFFWHFIENESQIEEFIDYNRKRIKKVYTNDDL
jgi:hypothetical protein